MGDRSNVVALARSWVGQPVKQHIIDVYNKNYQLSTRKIKMQNNWAWCACTWSALGLETGNHDKMGVEISCGELIKIAIRNNSWVENDGYIPSPGDGVLYSWGDSGIGDNLLWPDHIGAVDYTNGSAGNFVVIEGNYNNAVKRRTVPFNSRYIRGFIVPKYEEGNGILLPEAPKKDLDVTRTAREVISGLWGNGTDRRQRLEAAGYLYREVQDEVCRILNGNAAKPNGGSSDTSPDQPTDKPEVIAEAKAQKSDIAYSKSYKTTSDLYCRTAPGNNKKALCVIPKGATVRCYGFYSVFNGTKWLYITFKMDGVSYTGFSSSNYLEEI